MFRPLILRGTGVLVRELTAVPMMVTGSLRQRVSFQQQGAGGARLWAASSTSTAGAGSVATEANDSSSSNNNSSGKNSNSSSSNTSNPLAAFDEPIPEEVVDRAPPGMRWYWLAGLGLVLGSAGFAFASNRDFRAEMQSALALVASVDEQSAVAGLDQLERLLRRQHRSLTGLTVVRTSKDVLLDNGAVEALVHAVSRPNASSVLRRHACDLLIRVLRDAPAAKWHLAQPALVNQLLDVLELPGDGATRDTADGGWWLRAAMLLDLMVTDVDARQDLSRNERLADLLRRRTLGAGGNDEWSAAGGAAADGADHPLVQLMLVRVARSLATTDHGELLLLQHGASTAQQAADRLAGLERLSGSAVDAALNSAELELVPTAVVDQQSRTPVPPPAKKLLDAVGLSLFGLGWGYARWTVRLWRAGTPLRGAALVRFATRKSKVGKSLFALLALDLALSETQRNWDQWRLYLPELGGAGGVHHDEQQSRGASRSPELTSAARWLPSYELLAPLGQTATVTALWLVCQRRQHFMLAPTAAALAHFYWNDLLAVMPDKIKEQYVPEVWLY